ncbi:MAG: Vault protein inter-alpha-trypsin [Syntrophorhabdus sp. PtaU1.Bin002]|nr:MAG: Vault protein inter-alpha-trypsin [Syntrophorhabdus sp. PtaU1.Bin002]
MNRITQSFVLLVALLSILCGTLFGKTLPPNPQGSDDKTLSPYFFVKSDDPAIDRLPLKSTSADVDIAGVIADVKVTQVYKNEGKKPIEAIYVFPASTRAAVYGMKMTIGKRVIEAKINKREEARRRYEEARDQGKSASLLEQQRPNVFQMNVANIMPGDEIKVDLKYTELLVPTDRIYEFVYPTVVGPRYSNQSAETSPASEHWTKNPYLHQGEAPTYGFDIAVNIAAGLPIKEISSTSHKVNTSYSGPTVAKVALDKSETQGGNRDYVLRYRLDGNRIQSGLLLYQGGKENFFLLTMQPPKRVTNAHIPGREYIFIVDVSGSMHGFPLDISKKLLRNLIGSLRTTDRFNVLLFSGGNSVLSEESLPATPDNIRKAITLIERQQGGGGTELLPALKRALSLKKAEGVSRTVVIATDGYVTVEEEAFDLIRNHLGDANMFAFGIGSSVNRHIIEGMAHVGMGEPFVLTKPEEADSKAERFRSIIQSPVLTQIKVKYNGFAAYDVEPVSIPDVLAERPVTIFGKWRGKPQGKITLTGISGEGKYTGTIDVSSAKPSKENSALRYLWARHRITLLSDYNKLRSDDRRINEVTELGLSYNLLTAYTSFVAIDTEVRNTSGKPTTIKQPLPLPQGVSDYAVGGVAPSLAFAPAKLGSLKECERQSLREEKVSKDETTKTKAAARIGDLSISGELSRQAVTDVVQKNIRDIKRCQAQTTLQGKLVLRLTIAPDGKVKTAKIISSTSTDKNVHQCIAESVKKWKFPKTVDGNAVQATITLLFGM